jgi:hypothetical protein
MLKLCQGTLPAPHDEIVYDTGNRWYICPLCEAIEAGNTTERELTEAQARITELEAGSAA